MMDGLGFGSCLQPGGVAGYARQVSFFRCAAEQDRSWGTGGLQHPRGEREVANGVAGRVGFEPTRRCYPLRHFQCRALGHYATSPALWIIANKPIQRNAPPPES